MRTIMIASILAILLIAGCLGEETPADNNQSVQEPPAVPVVKAPSFTILSPSAGEVVTAMGDSADITLALSTQNLVIKQPGGDSKAGEGHFHVRVDGGPDIIVTSKNYVLTGIEPGDHYVEVEIRNNDQTSYSPAITKSVSFSVEPSVPSVYAPQTYKVGIRDFAYEPAQLDVLDQDYVEFANEGAYPRSATCFIDGKQVFDTGILAPGASKTIQMNGVFECEYFSSNHRAMTGMITVSSNAG